MKDVEYFNWYLPNRNPRGKPYLSRFKMNAAEALERGAIRPEPTSREIRRAAESPEEREQLRRETDTSRAAGSRIR